MLWIEGPSAATRIASESSAAPTPIRVERHPRVTPTASTIVRASTISTALARKADRKRKTSRVMPPGWRLATQSRDQPRHRHALPCLRVHWLLDDGPGDGWRLAAGQEPAGRNSRHGHAGDREREVEHRHVAQVAEVVVVQRGQGDVRAGHAEQRAE